MELAHVKLQPDDGKHHDGEEEEQPNLQQGHHGLHDGLEDNLQACGDTKTPQAEKENGALGGERRWERGAVQGTVADWQYQEMLLFPRCYKTISCHESRRENWGFSFCGVFSSGDRSSGLLSFRGTQRIFPEAAGVLRLSLELSQVLGTQNSQNWELWCSFELYLGHLRAKQASLV